MPKSGESEWMAIERASSPPSEADDSASLDLHLDSADTTRRSTVCEENSTTRAQHPAVTVLLLPYPPARTVRAAWVPCPVSYPLLLEDPCHPTLPTESVSVNASENENEIVRGRGNAIGSGKGSRIAAEKGKGNGNASGNESARESEIRTEATPRWMWISLPVSLKARGRPLARADSIPPHRSRARSTPASYRQWCRYLYRTTDTDPGSQVATSHVVRVGSRDDPARVQKGRSGVVGVVEPQEQKAVGHQSRSYFGP